MNILINSLTLGRGGTERVIANLSNNSLIQKHNVTIITCAYQESSYDLNEKIKHICLDNAIDEINQNKFIRFIRRRRKLKELIKAIKPDIIMSFLPEPNFLVLSLRKFVNIPLIISVRNDPKKEYAFLPYKMMMRILYPKADGYVFQTEEAKNYFKFSKDIFAKSIVIPNPVNPDFIEKRYEGQRENIIVSVGRFDEQKNQKLLIRAFSKIANDYMDYKLVIYGEGKLRKDLEDYIKKLKLEDKVFLPGEKHNIKELIYKAKLFVLSSDYEGIPNSLMEAMALGLPVISTDCPVGGPRMLIQNGINGLLTKVNSDEELADAMKKIISNEDFAHKLGNEANKISITLAPEKIYKKWEDYINITSDVYNKI